MFKHILIPTDGSPIANKAVQAGIKFAREIGAEITGYHAIEDPFRGDILGEGYAIDPKTRAEVRRRAREQAQVPLDAMGKLAKAAGVGFDSAMTEVDTAYEGIIDAAKKHKCDVIFMASHGRRGVSQLFMGSVTQKVLTHCRIPVLVYR